MSAGASRLLLLPAVAFLLVVFALPVGTLLLRSVSDPNWGLQNFRSLWEEPVYASLIRNTVQISLATTLGCILLAYPYAHVMATRPRLTRLLTLVVLVPFWSSILVRSFAWMVLLQTNGIINQSLLGLGLIGQPLELIFNRAGVLIGMVHVLLPFMVFPIHAAIRAMDPALLPAAATLGAGPVRAFLRVQLPLTLPGLATGSVLVFVMALGFFITPALLGGRRDVVIARMIQLQVSQLGDWGMAATLSLVLLLATLLLLAASQRFLRAPAQRPAE